MKVRVLKLSSAVLVGLFLDGEHHYKITNPLPPDADIAQIQHSSQVGIVDVWVTSETFDEVPEGSLPQPHVIGATRV